MNANYEVSVIMPVYNAELYLKDAIDSILSQTFTNFELIIINDGSNDNTENIIKYYKDNRIVYVKNNGNIGLINTLNKGLKLARGKFIARMDADDISLPLRFQLQIDFFNAHPDVSLVGTAFSIIGTDTIVYHPNDNDKIKIKLLLDTALAHPSVMFVKKDFEEKKMFYNSNFVCAEDYKLWTDVSLSSLKIANLDNVLLKYRIHEQQISTARISEQHDSAKRIREQYANAIFKDRLSRDEYSIIKDGFRCFNPYKTIFLLLKMKKINEAIHYFNENEFELFFQDKLKDLMPILGKYDFLHLFFSKSPIKFKLAILKGFTNNLFRKYKMKYYKF